MHQNIQGLFVDLICGAQFDWGADIACHKFDRKTVVIIDDFVKENVFLS